MAMPIPAQSAPPPSAGDIFRQNMRQRLGFGASAPSSSFLPPLGMGSMYPAPTGGLLPLGSGAQAQPPRSQYGGSAGMAGLLGFHPGNGGIVGPNGPGGPYGGGSSTGMGDVGVDQSQRQTPQPMINHGLPGGGFGMGPHMMGYPGFGPLFR